MPCRPAWCRPRGAVVGLLSAGMVLALLAPAGAVRAQTLDDLDDVEEQVEQLEDELDAATDAYEESWAAVETALVELEELEQLAQQLEREAQQAGEAVGDRARSAFMRGATDVFEVLLVADSPADAMERAGMVEMLQRREGARIEEALALRDSLEQTRVLLAEQREDLEHRRQQMREEAEALQTELARAEEQAETIRSLVARQRRIDRGPQQGIYACIFDPGTFNFRDTWGHPRSGGRRHKGTDVFAPMNQPTFAFTAGVIERHSNSRLGGIGLYLRGDDNNLYYYAHLASIDANGAVGNRVEAGELVAYNGYSGNADPWAPHVHFELHPGGGAPINPYPWLAAVCF